jgi:uncharacterized protein YbjT (DUF2867 family)
LGCRLLGSTDFRCGYFRAKIAQENFIKERSIPYSIVRATQFFEFVRSIADGTTEGHKVRMAPVLFQPIAADDVASAVCRVASDAPLNGTAEIAGPEQFRFDELIRQELRASNDPREVITLPYGRYFGAEHGLQPEKIARIKHDASFFAEGDL